ncbi:MAG TPA: amino acid racemase [Caulobacteraceae bacterium]
MRAVGVLGGMGPAATLDFLTKVLAADPAPKEQDKIRILVDCNPGVLDRNAAARGEGPSPGPALAEMARGLVAAGADFLVIACNTAHAWAGDIAAAVDAPLISMIEAACETIAAAHPRARRIGLLAGQGCLDAQIYQSAFERRGWQAVIPPADLQAGFMSALYSVKAGSLDAAEKAAFMACAEAVIAAGAEIAIAGCTEVPLLLTAADLPVPLIDPTQILAERTVAFARG